MALMDLGPVAVDTYKQISGIGDAFQNSYDKAQKRSIVDEERALIKKYRDEAPGLLQEALGASGYGAQTTGGGLLPGVVGPKGSANPNDNSSRFINTIRAAGVDNPNALAAIAATGQHESAWSANNGQGVWNDPSQSGQSGMAGGFLSWRADRLNNLRKFAAANGDMGNGTPETQAKFLLSENPALIEQLKAARSPEEATSLMNNAWRFAGYDKPGGEAASRMASARAWGDKIGGGSALGYAPQPAPSRANSGPFAGINQPGPQIAETEDDVNRLQAEMDARQRGMQATGPYTGNIPSQSRNWQTSATAPVQMAQAGGVATDGNSGPPAQIAPQQYAPPVTQRQQPSVALLARMFANPLLAPIAQKMMENNIGGGYTFQVVGDQLFRMNAKTGEAVPVSPKTLNPLDEEKKRIEIRKAQAEIDQMTAGGKPPEGFTRGPNGLMPIPGGPADTDYLRKKSDATTQKDTIAETNRQREIEADRLGLQGDARLQYTTTGKLPTAAEKALPAELGARVAIAQQYMDAHPDLLEKVKKGGVTGVWDWGMAQAGKGEPGQILRQLKMGSEAIIRNLTGAGMNLAEAQARVQQYEPQIQDDADTVAKKMTMLNDALQRIEAEAYRGRGVPENRKGKNPYFDEKMNRKTDGKPTKSVAPSAISGKTKTGTNWSLED